jgi:hypothetical protein
MRYMTYDLTLWNFKVLDTLYKEAGFWTTLKHWSTIIELWNF